LVIVKDNKIVIDIVDVVDVGCRIIIYKVRVDELVVVEISYNSLLCVVYALVTG